MTAMTTTATRPRPPPASQRVTQVRVVRSEWTKLRSLPSTVWSLLAAVVADRRVRRRCTPWSGSPGRPPARGRRQFDPTAVSLTGVQLAQLAIGVLGVLLITGEYATGTIRISLAAVPARLPLLWGKAIVFALTALVAVPCRRPSRRSWSASRSCRRSTSTPPCGDPGVARAVLGSALFLTAVGLLGLGLGALLRNTAGAVAALFGLLFAPQLWSASCRSRSDTDHQVPARRRPAPPSPTCSPTRRRSAPWAGFGLFCLYTAVVLALAAWQLRRRDA